MRASLQAEYGIRLAEHGLGLMELADLVGGLPAGCALWQSIGGPMAWSEQMHMLNMIEHHTRVNNWLQTEDGRKNRNQPKFTSPPPFAHERDVVVVRQSAKQSAWERRQARNSVGDSAP